MFLYDPSIVVDFCKVWWSNDSLIMPWFGDTMYRSISELFLSSIWLFQKFIEYGNLLLVRLWPTVWEFWDLLLLWNESVALSAEVELKFGEQGLHLPHICILDLLVCVWNFTIDSTLSIHVHWLHFLGDLIMFRHISRDLSLRTWLEIGRIWVVHCFMVNILISWLQWCWCAMCIILVVTLPRRFLMLAHVMRH